MFGTTNTFEERAMAIFPHRFIFDAGADDKKNRIFLTKVTERFGPDAMPTGDSEPDGIWTYYRANGTLYFTFFFLNELDAIEAKLMG